MLTHQACEDCGSSDALTVYDDHSYCFACGKYTDGEDTEVEASGSLHPLRELRMVPISARCLSADTCHKFSYGVNGNHQVACYFDNTGTLAYQKTRDKDKNFRVLKGDSPAQPLKSLLFGKNVWGDYGGQRLLITEGEIDCLSAYEALGSLGFHTVSVPCGAQAALDTLKLNFEWLDRYQAIYIGFDNDEPGRAAAAEVCKSLGSSKVHLMNLPPDIKDINELWLQGGRAAVLEAYQTAKTWQPQGIIGAEDFYDIAVSEPERGWDWPWPTLNTTTFGIRPGLIMVTAGSGVGKTTWFKQVEAHCYKLGKKIGVIHLEEPARGTINGLLSLLLKRPFHVPNSDVTREERMMAIGSLVEERRLVLFDKQIGFDEDIILSMIRYMIQALGCDIVFLDHLTAITDQYDRDVNQRTRNFIVKLGKLVTSLEFPLLMISHLRKADGKSHEEGGRVHLDDMLGSGAIKQWAEHVFALERDNQNEDPQLRNRSVLRDLKNRPLGEFTGTVIPLEYDSRLFTLKEVSQFGKPTETKSSEPRGF